MLCVLAYSELRAVNVETGLSVDQKRHRQTLYVCFVCVVMCVLCERVLAHATFSAAVSDTRLCVGVCESVCAHVCMCERDLIYHTHSIPRCTRCFP